MNEFPVRRGEHMLPRAVVDQMGGSEAFRKLLRSVNAGEQTPKRLDKPHRIQLSRKLGWRKPEGAIVVARPTRWGNPFPVKTYGLDLSLALFDDISRGIWSPARLEHLNEPDYADAYHARTRWLRRIGGHPTEIIRTELAGHDLACWCRIDQPCHADRLLTIANGWDQ